MMHESRRRRPRSSEMLLQTAFRESHSTALPFEGQTVAAANPPNRLAAAADVLSVVSAGGAGAGGGALAGLQGPAPPELHPGPG